MEDPAPQMDADFTAASIASAGLRGLADACVGPITHQLYFNATSACEHAVAGYAEVADALTRACALAVSAARSRMNATDKWLQSQVDEFEACSKQLEGMERHCLSVQFDEAQDTVFGAVRLLETSCFMPTRSININLLHSEAKLKPQTRCVLGVDASMSRVSHPAVMARGTVNTICVECIGVDGQAVHGLAPVDVQWRLISRGWSVKGGIQVVENTVFVSIRLKEECASAAELHLLIGGARFVIPLTTAVTITGMLARTLELSSWCAYHCGLAISPDASILAVALSTRKIDIFRLSDGALHSTIGGNGTGPGQFSNLGRICFSPLSGHLLALDTARVQELTVAGAHVRSIDLSEMREACLSIAASREMIAVGTAGNGHQVWLYDQSSFELIRSFGTKGWDPGYLMDSYSLRFMPDGVHVIVAEDVNHRLSIFTSTGEFVRCVGVGTLDCPIDVDFASNGDVLVVDVDAERVTVFSGDGFSLLRSIDMTSFDSGAFKWPHALAVHGEQLFLLGRHGAQLLALN